MEEKMSVDGQMPARRREEELIDDETFAFS
jgi:hypothetical protein